ncbi:uncharacterized protein MONBRDRAFT_33936 [Monosiga brevicollis MX1]|uniref:Sushi domain-containing protein n=1 Tax=Monosiga brevicollis TaxID=81824 RepID=A9V8L3_MONBE|nr:uncharacterized protein MONBRDRAFT_33936 [Monosiga brevicollis MX1]EDQ86164.1 predicted protein [Monosiga brevicollis MX1]|eukprot:XP_001749089.1 hypothetical protein [Monosiga brevicollis MX1]
MRSSSQAVLLAGMLLSITWTSSVVSAVARVACTASGTSQVCHCDETFVNCDYVIWDTFPSLAYQVTHLSLANNALTELARSDLVVTNVAGGSPFLYALQSLDLHGNQLDFIANQTFTPSYSRLTALDLSQNQLTRLEGAVFQRLSALNVLKLNQNDITSIGATVFADLTALRELDLSDNAITYIHPDAFAALTNLETLTLSLNLLTALPDGLFAACTSLTELGLAVNNISNIPENVFPDVQFTLRMGGNPSECSMSGSTPVCTCRPGFGGDNNVQTNVAYCSPVNCGDTITNISHVNATADCSADPYFEGASCIATCLPGYYGIPANSVPFTCGTGSTWEGEIVCKPRDCGTTIPNQAPNSDVVFTGSTLYGGGRATATCRAGFEGGGEVYTCGTAGVWTPEVSLRCSRVSCGSNIASLDTNKVRNVICVDNLYGDQCEVTCRTGYVGQSANYTCSADGVWRGSISCYGQQCGRTIPESAVDATSQCAGDSSFGGDNCYLGCALGYEGDPIEYRCSSSGTWTSLSATTLPTCSRITCPTTIDGVSELRRQNTCSSSSYGDTCISYCQTGYAGAPVHFSCSALGAWTGDRTQACTLKNCSALDVSVLTRDSFAASDNCLNGTYGDTCDVYCLEGLFISKTRIIVAMSAQMCNIPAATTAAGKAPSTANVGVYDEEGAKSISITGCSTTYGSRCRPVCRTGTVAAVGNDDVITCGADGNWRGIFRCEGQVAASSSDLSTGQAAGIAVGIVVLLGLAALVVVLLLMRRRDSKQLEAHKKNEFEMKLNKSAPGDSTMTRNPMLANPARSSRQGGTIYDVTPARPPKKPT